MGAAFAIGCFATGTCEAAISATITLVGAWIMMSNTPEKPDDRDIPASDRQVNKNDNGGPPEQRQGFGPISGQNRDQLRTSERSLSNNVQDHKQKLADYRANPEKADNKGLLRGVSPQRREQIIQGRIRALEGQIKKNEGELSKVRQRLKDTE